MKKHRLNDIKGITLISLVVTIIVLLILAGVAIAMLRGDNGILNRASQTNVATEIGSFKERVNLAYMSLKTNIKSKITQTPGYIATTHKNLGNLVTELANEFDVQEPIVIAKAGSTDNPIINSEGYTIAYSLDTEGNSSTNGVGYIVIWYTNNKLRSQLNSDIVKEYSLKNTIGSDINSIKNELMLVSVIKVENYDASITEFDGEEKQTAGITSLAKAGVDVTEGQETTNVGTFRGTSVNGSLAEKDKSAGEGTTAPISTSKIFTGYYADVNDDGEVDGVIFADLSKAGSGTWNPSGNTSYDSNGIYSWEAKSNLNTYYIKKKNHEGKFGTADVIAPISLNQPKVDDRFYVMTLTDFTTPKYEDPVDSIKNYPAYNRYTWYENVGSNMNPLITSNDFGKGNENTKKMIEKWNAAGTEEGYTDATQENQDIWKHIQTIYDGGNGWFIPSRAEWAAFGGELEVNTTENHVKNYSNLSLKVYYWSSSQKESNKVWIFNPSSGFMNAGTPGNAYWIRLATTF